ncbi:undecaprenyl-phosphate glucose phosphotransferase [Dysgonomonas sp. 25]|uniref:undecaprenyl-phosphate glucose phosphotransferase n=1 Tax=Dysgonomonas sp. 25 TaxID=2302933 RepID=UPI0013D50D15|nr:undecaprenyl-phosphate glucose phosphotransferase [Dysgonomonas sp. 25]NDV68663.1 undecaprenyl-phosphate glucose phosphotransferase [Dysgonomonas sp. 25]
MSNEERREGYGYMINWIIRAFDLILLNALFLSFVYFLFRENYILYPSAQNQIILVLVINFSYFITSSLVQTNISENVVYFDKVVQNSTHFIVVYIILLTLGIVLCRVFHLTLSIWIMGSILNGTIFVLWRILLRLALKKYRARGKNFKVVVIVGGTPAGASVYEQLTGSDYGYKILGYFDDDPMTQNVFPTKYLGRTSDFERVVQSEHIDEIYCCLVGDREKQVNALITYAEKHMIRFFLVPEYFKYIRRRMTMRFLNNIPLMSLRNEPLQYSANRIWKRSFDIVFSLIILLTIFPLMYIICGSLIKLSSKGPVFFKQKRTGIQGHEFYCYKFRSMRPNNDANLKSATKDDPRLTWIGKFMRATSIDEFPQFINVLKGDMSIVGPRPHMLKHTELYSELIGKFMVRHLVKPGITGWAQVSGCRGEIKSVEDMEKRVQRDVWYIENWSMFLDIKIIFLTAVNIFKGEENAY